MSNIYDLIKKSCPNGVELKKLKDLCKIETGKLNANEAVGDGKYNFFTTAKEISKINKYRWDAEALLIAGNANVGDVKYYNGKFEAYQRTYVLTEFLSTVDVKYLYHVLSNDLKQYLDSNKNEAAMTYIVLKTLEEFEIAIPPLDIQREIVKILDKFGELEAELEARKSQYEFWRDKIFKFENRSDVKWLKLKDIKTEIYRGNGIKRDQVTDDGIPCVRYGEIYTTYDIWFNDCKSHTFKDVVSNPKTFTNNDLLFAITGESVEEISKTIAYTGNDVCYAGGDIVVMKHNQNGKYLSYALSTKDAVFQKGKGKVKSKVVHSSVPSIEEIIVPIVSLEEQDEIVKKLDHFYNIINDISCGLPAEIELRRKQYEYYRNKLLSFEEYANE